MNIKKKRARVHAVIIINFRVNIALNEDINQRENIID